MKSPFSLGRFEHDIRFRHAYFLPPELHQKLAAGVSTYLIGGRGTGKTTLLKAFEWRERLNNPYLGEALQSEPFSDGIIGVYVKLSEHHLSSFQRWFDEIPEEQSAVIFGLYFDLLWLEDFAISISELARKDILRITIASERSFIATLSGGHIGRLLKLPANASLAELSQCVQNSRAALLHSALLKQSAEEFFKWFPAVAPGEAGRIVTSIFAEKTDGLLLGKNPLRIQVLLDEADALTEQQHVIVNTAIRLAKAPLSYTFSSIKKFRDVTTTTIPNISVQRDDCQVLMLDGHGNADFQRLVEGVATVRMKRSNLEHLGVANLSRWFGSSSINAILHDQLTSSLSARAKKMLADTKDVGRLPYFGQSEVDNQAGEKMPSGDFGEVDVDWDERYPIYQTHLIRRLKLEPPLPNAPYHIRRQKYAEMRKKMVAAYLDICRILSISPLYAGYRMILGLSDSSVRDFLLQLNELFSQAQGNMDRLTQGKLSIRDQDIALRRASDQKISTLPDWVRLPHEKVVKYVDTFGFLTSELQSGDDGVGHLLSSEKGVFLIPEYQIGDKLDEHREVIGECIATGYFTAEKTNEGGKAFRVHGILAPHYGFSYRGAYATVNIKSEHLRLISSSSSLTSEDRRGIAKQIAISIKNKDDVDQLKLF